MSEAHDFLNALWDGMPDGAGIQHWRRDTRKAYTFKDVKTAAKYIDTNAKPSNDNDIYTSAGLCRFESPKPLAKRLNAQSVVGIPGVWADIDINGGPEDKTGAAPDHEAAMSLAEELLQPTIVVNSGYGIQAWWLFEEGPWVFDGDLGDEQRLQAARLVAAFQTSLRLRAKRVGFGLDSTHDLARLMRVPGAYNCKGMSKGVTPVPVTLLDADGPRHSIVTIGAVVQEFMGEAQAALRRVTGEGVEIVLRGQESQPPIFKLEQLMEANPDFRIVWEHRPAARTRGWSMSEFEMSIANHCVRAGFTDQELADTLVYHRLKWGDAKGKASRVDYIAQVIGKARQSVEEADDDEELEIERTDAVDQLASMAKVGAQDPHKAAHLLTKVVGGPEVKALIQDGRDPDTARFRIELSDGREVPIGPASVLIDHARFRERFMVVTGKLPHVLKRDKWDKVVQAMLDNAVINEDIEDERAGRVKGWLDGYLDQGLSTDKDAACQARDPFIDDEDVYIYLDSFAHWLRRIRGERMASADLKQLMMAAGFARRTVNYATDTGKKSSRSYWTIARDHLNI